MRKRISDRTINRIVNESIRDIDRGRYSRNRKQMDESLSSAATGAALGSFIPGVGTVAGGAIGAVAPTLWNGVKGFWNGIWGNGNQQQAAQQQQAAAAPAVSNQQWYQLFQYCSTQLARLQKIDQVLRSKGI